jgi:hypothetical protein
MPETAIPPQPAYDPDEKAVFDLLYRANEAYQNLMNKDQVEPFGEERVVFVEAIRQAMSCLDSRLHTRISVALVRDGTVTLTFDRSTLPRSGPSLILPPRPSDILRR